MSLLVVDAVGDLKKKNFHPVESLRIFTSEDEIKSRQVMLN